jgi:hypothetical protein
MIKWDYLALMPYAVVFGSSGFVVIFGSAGLLLVNVIY